MALDVLGDGLIVTSLYVIILKFAESILHGYYWQLNIEYSFVSTVNIIFLTVFNTFWK